MTLTGTILKRDEITESVANELYRLYAAHYAPTSPTVFARDLGAKAYSIIVRDTTGRICGFSTVARLGVATSSGRIEVLFSGDTVVEQAYWGEQTVPFTWIEEAGRIKAEHSGRALYWLLITKGHRTFRYLPAFAYSYCPGPDPALQTLRNEIAMQMFGDRFDAKTGVLNPDPDCPTALRPAFAGLDEARAANPNVQAFLRQNPGHARGEELVCLCELSAENLRPRARSWFEKGAG